MSDSIRFPAHPFNPVRYIESDGAGGRPEPGIGLCLSGGGYRAMLFHLGSLVRLNEAALLPRLARVSSVSGGSIVAALLGLAWRRLGFENGIARNFESEVVAPIRRLACMTVDACTILRGILFPGTVNEKLEKIYNRSLFRGARLSDLPTDSEGPRFVINATNVQTGALFRFSRPYMADYLVGMIRSPRVTLAKAVAASTAFPPVLSPCILRVSPDDFVRDESCSLQCEPYTSRIMLTDGGVYDNMGLETVWKKYKTVLVSDAGGKMRYEEKPKRDWVCHAYRIFQLTDNQVRSLRKRQIIDAFKRNEDHDGAYWGIRSGVRDFGLADAIDCPIERTTELADIPTRLAKLDTVIQKRLINWGYAITDTAIRAHIDASMARGRIPYPREGI